MRSDHIDYSCSTAVRSYRLQLYCKTVHKTHTVQCSKTFIRHVFGARHRLSVQLYLSCLLYNVHTHTLYPEAGMLETYGLLAMGMAMATSRVEVNVKGCNATRPYQYVEKFPS